jgi:hypothetical protein
VLAPRHVRLWLLSEFPVGGECLQQVVAVGEGVGGGVVFPATILPAELVPLHRLSLWLHAVIPPWLECTLHSVLNIHDMLGRARCQTHHKYQLPKSNKTSRSADGKTAEGWMALVPTRPAIGGASAYYTNVQYTQGLSNMFFDSI